MPTWVVASSTRQASLTSPCRWPSPWLNCTPYCEFADGLTGRGIQFIVAGYDIPSIRGMGRAVATNHCPRRLLGRSACYRDTRRRCPST